MKALLRHTGDMAFLCKANSNHWVVLDSSAAAGGPTGSSSPIESLVMAAGGCVSMDLVFILGKARKTFSRFEMEVEAQRAESHPRRIVSMHFHATFAGDLNGEDITKALNLSLTKYCSVTLSLDRSVEIKASFTCNGTPGAEWIVPRNPEIYE